MMSVFTTVDNSIKDLLEYGSGKVVIVAGWSPLGRVKNLFNNDLYAVAGSLYSLAGIDLLIRNLLANSCTEVVILNCTKQDKFANSVGVLVDFFNKGFQVVNGKYLVNSGKGECWIGGDINQTDLDLLRAQINIRVYDSLLTDASADFNLYYRNKNIKYKPTKIYPALKLPETDIVPGEVFGHRVECGCIAETWLKLVNLIRKTGKARTMTDGLNAQELINVLAVVKDEPENFYLPNYFPVDHQMVKDYVPQLLTTEGDGVVYTYGQRLKSYFGFDQIESAIIQLKNNPNSSRINLNLWDVGKDNFNSNPPCLVNLTFRVVENKLALTAVFRSNDMINAWPCNAIGLRALQDYVGKAVEIPLAPLMILSESAHIYAGSYQFVDGVIGKNQGLIKKLSTQYNDPSGNFIISVCNGQIVVKQTTFNGELVKSYLGTSAKKLLSEILFFNPGVQITHCWYLGYELAQAEAAIKQGLVYKQGEN